VSRIITGRLRLELEPADLASIVQDAIEVVRPSADAKRLRIEFQPPEEPPLLVADAARLQQVVWNLLSNATKFTEARGTITISIEREGSKLVLAVRDTGCGVEPEFLPFMFDRFKQADATTTWRVGGLGLGLAIVRHIVELHGGNVRASSAGLGRGTTFHVTLPVRAVARTAPGADAGAQRRALTPPPVARSLSGLRVMVVDDEPDARDLLETLLTEAGAEVACAASAGEALELLPRFRPNVLISDIGMPDVDGYGLMRQVRAVDPRLPSIALTAYARREDRSKALAVGFTSHLGKPVNPERLLSLVEDLARAAPGSSEPS
jgi:CheY-like chemotaxis protein